MASVPATDPLKPLPSLHALRASQPMLAPEPTFGYTGSLLNNVINGVAGTVYATDGARYAFEQTLGYTVPRTVQQLLRTQHITGETNPQAAKEMFVRDTLADVEDTFLPGMLATLLIARAIDTAHDNKTLVKSNIPLDHLEFYGNVAKSHGDEAGFFNHLERVLHHAAGTDPGPPLGLQESVAKLAAHEQAKGPEHYWRAARKMLAGGIPDPQADVVQSLAQRLGLTRLDLTLNPDLDAAHDTGLAVELPKLIRDLTHIKQHDQWGNALADSLNRTGNLKGWQALATVSALALSLYTPQLLRKMTLNDTGCDDFPGTQPIERYYRKVFGLPKDYPKVEGEPQDGKCHPFPYLTQSWKAGNKWPTLFTAGFNGVIGGIVANDLFDFKQWKPRFNSGKQLLETYAYERAFPWTPVKQMAVTYGLLCGLRVANARNDNEFREVAVKDAMLGWWTLTYFFPNFRNLIASKTDAGLKQQLVQQKLVSPDQLGKVSHLLMKPELGNPGKLVLREKSELTHSLVQTVLGVGEQAARQISHHLESAHNKVTVGTGAFSVFLIAFLEPQIGIWITNHLERKKWEDLARQYHDKSAGAHGNASPAVHTASVGELVSTARPPATTALSFRMNEPLMRQSPTTGVDRIVRSVNSIPLLPLMPQQTAGMGNGTSIPQPQTTFASSSKALLPIANPFQINADANQVHLTLSPSA